MASGNEARTVARIGAAMICACMILMNRSYVAVQDQWSARLLSRLVSVREFRTVEPRLSIELPYAPFQPSASLDRSSALRVLQPSLTANLASFLRTSADERRHGLVDLLLTDWDAAIVRLAPARDHDATQTPWLDLAAAYYMRGRTTRSLTDFMRALEYLSRANPSPAVTFNRALILEQLHDREAATAQWRAYLTIDDRSEWAAEARAHLIRISWPRRPWQAEKLLDAARRSDIPRVTAIVNSFPLLSRKALERDVLPSWADATLARNTSRADLELRTARSIAIAIASADRLPLDAVMEIERFPEKRPTLAKAYAAYGRGRRAAEVFSPIDALRELTTAKAIFDGIGSCGAALTIPFIAMSRYHSSDHEGAEAIAQEALTRYGNRTSDYNALFAHLAVIRGMIATIRGDGSVGIREFSSALRHFERLGEPDQQAAQHAYLADTYQILGDVEAAAVHRYQAIALTDRFEESRRLLPILSEAADASLAMSLPASALVFQDRAVRAVRDFRNPFFLADALMTRSTILRRNGQRAAALRDLREARQAAEAVGDPAARERTLAHINAAEAFAWREADDRRAIQSLDSSIAFFRRVKWQIHLAQLLLERGRAHVRLGDERAAEQDFHDGIAALEEQRRQLQEAELRITYFDRAETLFSELAIAFLRRGRQREAFDLLERSRARELLAGMDPMPLPELQHRVGPGVTVVTYAITRRALVSAVVTQDELRIFTQVIGEDELGDLADAISRSFDSGARLPSDALRRLSDVLIAPLHLRPGMRVVFIPDRFLYNVPFAALRLRSGRYLIEDHVITIAPSATLFVRNASRDCLLARNVASSALIVSSADRPDGFEALEPLPHAHEEALKIAKLYAGARVSPSEQSPTAILADASQREVVHFGTHSVLNEKIPGDSMLLIGKTGRLRASEIEDSKFPRTRLVVLGACSTGIGKTYRGEGVISLARSFLSASVPSVVGTIAPVEDATAAKLLTTFHAAFARGRDAASAMRVAQLDMLRHRGTSWADPARWSAFQVIGGTCSSNKEREEVPTWVSN